MEFVYLVSCMTDAERGTVLNALSTLEGEWIREGQDLEDLENESYEDAYNAADRVRAISDTLHRKADYAACTLIVALDAGERREFNSYAHEAAPHIF
jgi:hypothetical protein